MRGALLIIICIWLCMALGLCHIFGRRRKLDLLSVVYEWSQLEFDYATPKDRQAAIDNKSFIPGNIVPIDVDVSSSQKVFVTSPRIQKGIPATLGFVSNKRINNNPTLSPYPSWSWHTDVDSCKKDRIVSVFRTQIDECQRLWVLDTGQNDADKLVCPPQIIAFDLKTNQVAHRYETPASQYNSSSTFVTPIVDVRDPHGNCSNTVVYAADSTTYALIVYDVQRNTSWRITDKSMNPDSAYASFNISGDSPQWLDGILGMALSPYRPGKDRILYYHALSNDRENFVFTSDLRNQSRFINNPSSSPQIFRTFPDERYTQSAAEAIDDNGIMYFGLVHNVSINCWNTWCPYQNKNFGVVGESLTKLQFASGVKVIGGNKLWVMTSRFQKWAAGTLDPNDVNFRILSVDTEKLKHCRSCLGY